jgi:hypothetical protein
MEFKNTKIKKIVIEDLYTMAKLYEENKEEDKMVKYYIIASEQKHIDSIKELIKYYMNKDNNDELNKYKQLLEDITSEAKSGRKPIYTDEERRIMRNKYATARRESNKRVDELHAKQFMNEYYAKKHINEIITKYHVPDDNS